MAIFFGLTPGIPNLERLGSDQKCRQQTCYDSSLTGIFALTPSKPPGTIKLIQINSYTGLLAYTGRCRGGSGEDDAGLSTRTARRPADYADCLVDWRCRNSATAGAVGLVDRSALRKVRGVYLYIQKQASNRRRVFSAFIAIGLPPTLGSLSADATSQSRSGSLAPSSVRLAGMPSDAFNSAT